jgi:flagellar basal-body rod protein FlgG
MLRALNTAATGMEAASTKLDVISNNLANVNTTGFKKSRADFQDLLYQTVRAPGLSSASGVEIPTGLQVGLGVRTIATQRIFSQGDMRQTGNQLDLSIEGGGFFQVTKPDGNIGYTRTGSFKRDSQGRVVTSDGYPLEPEISIPPDAEVVVIASDGVVSVKQAGQASPTEVGQVQTANFVNPAGLLSLGRNLAEETVASGAAVVGNPGSEGLGTLAQGS